MNQEKIKCIIEAALMVSDKPLSMARILALFEKDIEEPDREMVKAALDQLQEDYKNRGIEVCEVASGYRVQVKSDYAEWVNRLFDEKPPRYSRALLETLAIIAYRQPLTRAEIEDIRGVGVSTTIIKTLQEREWIKVRSKTSVVWESVPPLSRPCRNANGSRWWGTRMYRADRSYSLLRKNSLIISI